MAVETSSPIIDLDAHSTTPVDPQVLQAMLPYFSSQFANADSQHRPGRLARSAVDAAREQIAALLKISSREFFLTSGATEANNLVLKGVAQGTLAGSHIIVNAAEHASVLDVALRLRRRGTDVTVLPVDGEGRVSPEAVAEAITDHTVLVSVMLANNEIGAINDLDRIGTICRDEGVLFHTDAVAALGRIPVDLSQLPVDLATFSAHKIYGPKGVGGLFVRRSERRIRLEPQLHGGGQEQHLRSGTLAVPLIVGFGEACRLAGESLTADAGRLAELRERLRQRLAANLPNIRFNGPKHGLPGNLNVSMAGVDGPALLTALEIELAVSSGAACSSAQPEPSHVLRAIGLPDDLCRASLRIGIGRFNTPTEMDQAAIVIEREVNRLRSLRNPQ